MPVIDFKVTRRKPYDGGQQFGEAGAYEQIDGLLTFAVDPGSAANQSIVDLGLASRDSQGRVRFQSDFCLVTPETPSNGNGNVLVELVNRGRRIATRLNRVHSAENPPDPPAGDGFLYRNGWSVASLGWQWDVMRIAGLYGFEAPPVLADGLPLSGQSIVTIRPNYLMTTYLLANRLHQPYAAARLDDPDDVLLVRDHEEGEDTIVPRDQWRFAREAADGSVVANREHVYMASGFEPGKVYNLVYTADGAKVAGAGLLAFRDVANFLRDASELNPSAGFERIYGFGLSQTGRMLRHYLYLGLNLDEAGRQAYDGLLVHVAGARRGEFNHRFAQPSVQLTPNFGHQFPFSDDEAVDPYSERRDGLLKRQRELGGVPKLIYTNTSAEYWRGDAALLHVDALGQGDLEPAPEVRIYHFAGTQHLAGTLPQVDVNPNEGTRGRYKFNVVDYSPLYRAALVNLDAWVRDGTEPPPSAHSRLGDGTLVSEEDVLATFDTIPGMHTPDPGHLWRIREVDLGPDSEDGIGSYPAQLGREYARFVPKVDADGNELAGVRLPDITVPVGTHTGWNPRHPETGSPDQILSMMGFTRFFAPTAAQRQQTGDPRPSLQERYAGRDEYLSRVREEALKLAAQRYVVEEDIPVIEAAAAERYDEAVRMEHGTGNTEHEGHV